MFSEVPYSTHFLLDRIRTLTAKCVGQFIHSVSIQHYAGALFQLSVRFLVILPSHCWCLAEGLRHASVAFYKP